MKQIGIVVALSVLIVSGFAQADANEDDVCQIQSLISRTYDRPDQKVEADPVVVESGHALADWTQGEMGGRALLQRRDGKWILIACGGDGFKDARQLQDAGLSYANAKALVAKLQEAERHADPERVRRFSLFGQASAKM
ncbi:MAG TPA: copper uptake system-associated protein [Paraburkholderia sp.]|uniref:copper uptake system-associated protein n=1 Tax=Paraburkholderia sp. TaxID=1926495 RepID=UPI002C6D38DC|nr:copper uptake system-associated protein [Paraburkholderia sp.]HTR08603.1 copper uptake system-associated protein [Paraburkholderia sp.]